MVSGLLSLSILYLNCSRAALVACFSPTSGKSIFPLFVKNSLAITFSIFAPHHFGPSRIHFSTFCPALWGRYPVADHLIEM